MNGLRPMRFSSRPQFNRQCMLLALLLCTALISFSAAADETAIRVGSEIDFRPYAFTDQEGQPKGFSVDLIKAVTEAMGLRAQVSTGSWNEVWNGLLTGRYDVLPIVAKSASRQQAVDFSLPHTETFDAFFVRAGSPLLPDLAAANGKEVVVMQSDAAHHELAARGFSGRVVTVKTIPEGLRLVASGRHDAFLCSKLIGTLEIRQSGISGVIAGPAIPDYKRVFAFAVRRGNAELLEKLNQGLLIVKTNGEYDRIYSRWLVAASPWYQIEKYFLPVVAGGSSILLLAAGLVLLLQSLVRKRTRQLALVNEDLRTEMMTRQQAQDELRDLNATLEQRVAKRTEELRDAQEATLKLLQEANQARADALSINEKLCREITDREQAEKELQQRANLNHDLNEINKLIHSTLDLNEIMCKVISRAAATLGSDTSAISLREGDEWVVRYVHGFPESVVGTRMRDEQEPHAVLAIKSKRPVAISDALNDERVNREHMKKWGVRSVLVVPLIASDEVRGVIFFNNRDRVFIYRDSHIVFAEQLASSVTLALQNAQLYQKIHTELIERERAQEALKEADRKKDQFLAMLAHELRNPMAAISAAAALLSRRDVSVDKAQLAKTALKERISQLGRLIDDLLDVSRITRGKIELRKENLDLALVIARAVDSAKPFFDERNQQLLVRIIDPLPVFGDAVRLEQIVANLLTNASRYSDAGKTIHLTAFRREKEAIIQVRDEGIGVPAALLSKIFEPFVQAENTLARTRGGLGLGLTIAKSLCEMHEGSISLRSEGAGKGSEFEVRLPLGEAYNQAAFAEGEIPGSRPLRILLIEDHADTAIMSATLLESEGHAVEIAEDAPSGVKKALEFKPHVILLDIGLPGFSGYEVAEKLRQLGLSETLIIAITGYGQEQDLVKANQAGIDHHLLKPVEWEKLRLLLATHGEKRPAGNVFDA